MGTMIVHKDGLFFEFSSVSDMVSSPVLSRVEFEALYLAKHGRKLKAELDERMERAVRQGSSSYDGENAYEAVRGNAEGLSLKRILLEKRGTLLNMPFEMALGLLRAGVRIRLKVWTSGAHIRLVDFKRWGPRLVWAGGCHGEPNPETEFSDFEEVEFMSDMVLATNWEVVGS